jgi:hypothetical protein
LIERRNEEMMN